MTSDKKYLLISMDDDRAKKLADVLGNRTCKKIIDLLAEKDASEKEISTELKIPINTIEYNLKKLLNAEIIEKSKQFFWSQKGKKIDIYRLSNKSIIISPKSKISSKVKSILPATLLSVAGAIGIKYYFSSQYFTSNTGQFRAAAEDAAVKSAPVLAEAQNYITTSQPFPVWGWFLAGAIFALLIIAIINWRKL
jgi:DNA-binding transcriptional ArsR family regulator